MDSQTQISTHLMKRILETKPLTQICSASSQPKTNQVGTVLLYGIPIVSLFIESQERLCLAQISNTLLKQFSYNEIHNRRVALGITCVQCTPVQLEILRRAGAMPVSSRRCGMITRREAERLCKSFLGDNAPPRLPDDFAFSVHHECAWGCSGLFLPSRYNSSRAKCIKCTYCGLFFSPNKFIFHSHRIGPNDKYTQPDAANFNSWRRHMKLSGNPPEEIIHAWEDVKAMFNGGTRKRLIGNSSSSSSSSLSQKLTASPKRIKATPISPSIVSTPSTPLSLSSSSSSSTIIGAVTTSNLSSGNITNGCINGSVNSFGIYPIKPINIHPSNVHLSTSATAARIPNLVPEISLPFSRSFMMDYMWHHTQNHHHHNNHQTKENSFQLPSYALPWLKRPSALLFQQTPTTANTTIPATAAAVVVAADQLVNTQSMSPPLNSSNGVNFESKPFNFYNNSAFKPVIQQLSRPISDVATLQATPLHANEDNSLTHCIDLDSGGNSDNTKNNNGNSCPITDSLMIKEPLSSDDEMVDIETTEDETVTLNVTSSGFIITNTNSEPDDCYLISMDNSVGKDRNIGTGSGTIATSSSSPSLNKKDNIINTDGNNFEETVLLTSILTKSRPASAEDQVALHTTASIVINTTSSNSNNNNNNNNNIKNNNDSNINNSNINNGIINNSNSKNNNNNNNINMNNDDDDNNNYIRTSGGSATELWSVARLSSVRPDLQHHHHGRTNLSPRAPFYRHDIHKNLHVYRHSGTTHTHGVV